VSSTSGGERERERQREREGGRRATSLGKGARPTLSSYLHPSLQLLSRCSATWRRFAAANGDRGRGGLSLSSHHHQSS
ncbi:unnamed protein product, partial [Ectocarpus sp. 6 AP-2014]